MFEQDDVENWVSLTSTAAGSMARRLLLNSRMGILEDGTAVSPALPPDQWSGPGESHVGYAEFGQRNLLARWADYLERPAGAPPRTSIGVRPATGNGEVNGTSPNGGGVTSNPTVTGKAATA
jgi:hypothetical protein